MENPPTALNLCLETVWGRTQKKHLYAGLLAVCVWAIPIFLIGVLVDRHAFLPAAGRWGILLVLLAVSFYQAWRRGWRHLRRFDPMRSALQIENHQCELDSLLVTAVQFRDSGATPGTSSSLWQATLRKADEASKSLRVAEIVNFAALKRPLRLAALLALVIGVFAAINAPFLAAGLARIFAPWTTVSYPTKTRIQIGERTLILKEGDAAKIEARLSGVVPEVAEFELVTGEGRPKEIDIEVLDGVGTYAIASASRDFRYRIKAGDARSDWHDVRVIPAPRIDDVKVVLEYPAYLEMPAETVEALTLTVPEGTRVKWQLTLDQPIRKAVLNRDGQDPLELKIGGDGRGLVIEELVQASRGYSFSWVDKKHGFEFTSPRYHMQVASDQAPRVELVSPESNVSAMLGRQLDLIVRAQDDHGIGSATITHRVNLRPEKTVPLPTPLRNGEGEQKVGWDYRKELTDLKIGDTVSFVVEVGDRYPAPHLARTEMRRITFLSREDYLAQIEKKLDRMLSRVRAIYRQERAAHALVRGLDATGGIFSQTCQLEAIRQEMLREQLKGTAVEVRELLADLSANNISDAVENESLKQVCAGLDRVADGHIAQAANLLREQAGAAGKDTAKGLAAADAMVNKAARELGGLVMQRGIDAAREVFALETQMLAREQATLRLRAIEMATAPSDEAVESLSGHQEEVAAWTDALLKDLAKGMRYDKRPLAVLDLTRRMKEIHGAQTQSNMMDAAALTRKKDFAPAAEKQAAIIKPLLKAEFSVRTGAEYSAIVDTRELLVSLLDQQAKLRAECEAMTAEQFGAERAEIAARQMAIRKPLLEALVPSIPAARTSLFDEAMPIIPPVDALRAAAEKSMGESLAGIQAGAKEAAVAKQQASERSLAELSEIVTKWSADLAMRTQGLTSLVSTAINRGSRIEESETRQIGLLEQSEEAALDEKPTKALAEAQRLLADDMIAFKKELLAQDMANPDKDVPPLVDLIEIAATAMTKAAAALESEKAEDALAVQEEASAALALAKELVVAQGARLALLQDILSFRRAVGSANQSMLDIVNEQKDLIKATEDSDEDALEALMPTMKNMLQCLTDVAPLLDLVAGRMDAGSALLFAASDTEDALAALEDGDQEDSLDAQEVAAESLAKVQVLVQAVTEQTTYLAEIVEFLHQSLAAGALMESGQREILQLLEAAPAEVMKRQKDLQKIAESYGLGLARATGIADYSKAGQLMAEAVRFGEAGDNSASAGQMKLAEAALKGNADQLLLVIGVLHGLSTIEVLSTSPPELAELLEALTLASDQRQIYRQARFGKNEELPGLASRQQKLEPRYTKLNQKEAPHPQLVMAQEQALQATAALLASARGQALPALTTNDESLRHFIVAQAILLNTAVPPASSSDSLVITDAESTDLSMSLANAVSDFVSGEAPKDKRTEWETLGTRNRAALNQNFARELPLEFRGMLKDYYEKVAK